MIGRLARAFRAPDPPELGNPAGGLPWSDLYPATGGNRGLAVAAYQPMRSIPSSAAPALLAPANPARRSVSIVNDGTATLYIGQDAPPSSTSYAVALGAGQTWISEDPGAFRGNVWGSWSAVNGSARVSETV